MDLNNIDMCLLWKMTKPIPSMNLGGKKIEIKIRSLSMKTILNRNLIVWNGDDICTTVNILKYALNCALSIGECHGIWIISKSITEKRV